MEATVVVDVVELLVVLVPVVVEDVAFVSFQSARQSTTKSGNET